jgi:hypothetical protein
MGDVMMRCEPRQISMQSPTPIQASFRTFPLKPDAESRLSHLAKEFAALISTFEFAETMIRYTKFFVRTKSEV